MSASSSPPSSTSSSSPPSSSSLLRFAIPKGRMKDNVLSLLTDAGIHVSISDRGYRPSINLPNYCVKLLKPQNIIEMLNNGSRDVGFGGSDWVANLQATHVVDLLDTKLDPVRVVAAGPSEQMLADAIKTGKHLAIASEYEHLTKDWIKKKGLNASFVRAYGATESFPPEDADLIVDNTATGSTLKANGLSILDTVFTSSTHLYANEEALKNPEKKEQIDSMVLLLKSVLGAREKAMVTFNVMNKASLDLIVETNKLPCMRAPTVSELHHGGGYAVSACVSRSLLPSLLPQLSRDGAQDIVVSKVEQIIF